MIHRNGAPIAIDAERAAAVLAAMAARGLISREEQAAIHWAAEQVERVEELERTVLVLRIELGHERAIRKATDLSGDGRGGAA